MPTTLASTDKALLDAASDVALRLRAFESYRGSQRRATTALKRRQPGFSEAVYEQVLEAAIVLFDTACQLVDAEYKRMQASGPVERWPEHLVPSLATQCPGFPPSTYLHLLNWVNAYYHQM